VDDPNPDPATDIMDEILVNLNDPDLSDGVSGGGLVELVGLIEQITQLQAEQIAEGNVSEDAEVYGVSAFDVLTVLFSR